MPPSSRYQNWLATSSAAESAISSPRFFSSGPDRGHDRPGRGRRSGPAAGSSTSMPDQKLPVGGGLDVRAAGRPRPGSGRPAPAPRSARAGTSQAEQPQPRRPRASADDREPQPRLGPGRSPPRAATRPRHAGIQPAARPIRPPASGGAGVERHRRDDQGRRDELAAVDQRDPRVGQDQVAGRHRQPGDRPLEVPPADGDQARHQAEVRQARQHPREDHLRRVRLQRAGQGGRS